MIYCKNIKCPNFAKFDEPLEFSFGKFYKPFGKKDLLCPGMCKIFCGFVPDEKITRVAKAKFAICTRGSYLTCNVRCLWNKDGNCARENILVDKNEKNWVCKCQSDEFISGHMDWSQLAKRKDMF
jgi:hypothetical protein